MNPLRKTFRSNTHSWGFTLVEMLVSMTLFSMVITLAFAAFGNIGILRTQVSSALDLNTEIYSATEKFVDLVKTGGDIDYEEYWNRLAVWTATASGHYRDFSGYGNYGSGGDFTTTYGEDLYYCMSGDASPLGTNWCLAGGPQRYGQYRQQFIDRNANTDDDWGDEDGDGIMIGDDDDEDLGKGPRAFTGGVWLPELYLIKKWTSVERTYFRWSVKPDPHAPPDTVCSMSGATMDSGCLGNIEMLKLVGKDVGMLHTGASVLSVGRYDGVIDTWECHPDFSCTLPSGASYEWVNIFPEFINVKSVHFYPYPEKDFRYAWKEADDALTLNWYVRIKLTLWLGWEKRKKIKWPSGDTTITTTINLAK